MTKTVKHMNIYLAKRIRHNKQKQTITVTCIVFFIVLARVVSIFVYDFLVNHFFLFSITPQISVNQSGVLTIFGKY